MKKLVLVTMAAAMMCGQSAMAQRTVKNIYTEQKTLQVEQVVMDQPVQLNRYLMAGYNTLCLPMTLSGEEISKAAPGMKVERLSSIRQEGNTLCLYFEDCTAQGIEAGVPYLVFSPKTEYLRLKSTDASAVSTELKTVRMADGQGNTIAFSSSWQQRQKEGLYGIPAKQDKAVLESILIRTDGVASFLPTRCGFSWEEQSATATAIEIRHGADLGDATGIKALQTADGLVDVYDMKGNVVRKQVSARSVKSELPAGVYIINGEKVIVR